MKSSKRDLYRLKLVACVALAVAGVASAAPPPGKGQCNLDISLKWEILDKYIDGTTVNAIQDDRLSPTDPPRAYFHGQNEVLARISVCAGTDNALLYVRYMSGGTRQAFVSFKDRLVASTGYTPAWTATENKVGCEGYNQCWMFGIENIKYLPINKAFVDEYEFTTTMGGHGPLYSKLSFFNPGGDVSRADDMFTAVANSPYPNSLIRVHHCPTAPRVDPSDLCNDGEAKEHWYAWPESVPKPIAGTLAAPPAATQVATLILNGMKKPQGPLNAGEFSIPFYFRITALQ